MVFRIVNFNKELDLYSVISNEGEQKNVTSFQIVKVMLQGYKFDNAYVTKRGFAIKTASGIRYIQVTLDNNTQMQLIQFMQEQRRLELEAERQKALQQEQLRIQQEQKRQEQLRQEQLRQEQLRKQQEQAKNQNTAKTEEVQNGNRVTKIQGSNNRSQKLLYRGTLYLSEESLCRKFNRDISLFKTLRSKGYSIDEALGVKPLRPEEELVSPKQIQRMLDSMARQRGEL